ncbi:MAG: hypothetical protein O7E52_11825 [Candidatus Poribacteria bacterium]|nr:hypothetical protein [Candidatus Poribacteria bacterium]
MKISLRKKDPRQLNKLYRRLLPFYMRPPILLAFMMVSLLGQTAWGTLILVRHTDLQSNLTIGFGLGVILGYIHGRWTARMWARDYLRVLKCEITFWEAKGATGTTVFVFFALGVPIFFGLLLKQSYEILIGLQSYIFGFIGGMNFALYLWVRRLPR